MTEREIKFKAFVKDDMETNRGRIVNCCDEIKFLLNHPKANEIFSKHYLNDILTYAVTFSEFYKQYDGFKCLQDFPIVNKQTLKDHWNEIKIEQYGKYSDNKEKFTSGSTGTPFKMLLDRYKHCRWIAGNKVFRENVGVCSHEKTVFISENIADKNIPPERMERDNVYYWRFKYFNDISVKDLLGRLKENKVVTLTAVASLLDELALYIVNENISRFDGEFLAVFSVSEALKERTRKIISDYFGCPVYVLYANEENGVLAVEDGSGLGCRANTADFLFEVLSMDSDTPVKDGEVGRLVITDFFNKAFPVIRYENGDLVAKKTMEDGRVYFTEIAGRKIDAIYTSDGRLVHYFEVVSLLEPYTDIKQFQLIQEDYHHFIWVLNTENRTYEDVITQHCKNLFGMNTEYKFEYVNEIPKLRSGKFRMTVSKIPEKNLKHAETL